MFISNRSSTLVFLLIIIRDLLIRYSTQNKGSTNKIIRIRDRGRLERVDRLLLYIGFN